MKAAYEESRRVSRRIVVEGAYRLETPAQLGGSDPTAVTDAPVARDAGTGRPILYGTTLAGLLRGCLADRLSGPRRGEDPKVACLFGALAGAPGAGSQSGLVVDDAIAAEDLPSSFRDGVALEPETGTVEQRLKYDYELVPAGTVFPLRLELDLDGDHDHERIDGLLTCMELLETGEVRVGGRSRRGLGRGAVIPRAEDGTRWTVHDFDLRTPRGMLEWIGFESQGAVPAGWPEVTGRRYASAQEFREAEHPERRIYPAATHPYFRAILDVRVLGSMLIRSVASSPDEPDAIHLTEGGRNLIAGTSLAGAVRARATRIARTQAGGDGPAVHRLLTLLFGPRPREVKREPRGGYLDVGESVIEDGRALWHTRVRIDRWTGAAADRLLFDAQPCFGGNARLELRLVLPPAESEPEQRAGRAAVGLLLCVLKDLFTGDLPVGGEGGTGRGRLLGEDAELVCCDYDGLERRWRLRGTEDRWFTVQEGRLQDLQSYLDAFNEFVANLPPGGESS